MSGHSGGQVPWGPGGDRTQMGLERLGKGRKLDGLRAQSHHSSTFFLALPTPIKISKGPKAVLPLGLCSVCSTHQKCSS
jgi:hypothetical protein